MRQPTAAVKLVPSFLQLCSCSQLQLGGHVKISYNFVALATIPGDSSKGKLPYMPYWYIGIFQLWRHVKVSSRSKASWMATIIKTKS